MDHDKKSISTAFGYNGLYSTHGPVKRRGEEGGEMVFGTFRSLGKGQRMDIVVVVVVVVVVAFGT